MRAGHLGVHGVGQDEARAGLHAHMVRLLMPSRQHECLMGSLCGEPTVDIACGGHILKLHAEHLLWLLGEPRLRLVRAHHHRVGLLSRLEASSLSDDGSLLILELLIVEGLCDD